MSGSLSFSYASPQLNSTHTSITSHGIRWQIESQILDVYGVLSTIKRSVNQCVTTDTSDFMECKLATNG